MNIIDVKLDDREVDPNYGVPADYISFIITAKDPDDPNAAEEYMRAPNNPTHPLYQEVYKWYKEQKNPGFEFRFKKPPKK